MDQDPRRLREQTDSAGTRPKPAPALRPGATVDHFRVLRELGRGGMGEVYLARDTRLGRRVAIKVLRSDTLGSQMAVERFLDEARTTARFSHPHIVTIHHVGEVDGNPYLALEYLEGRTLRDRLREEPPPVPETIRIGRAIAEALAEAHLHGVLHRDLKPENVMLPRDGRLRVVDFGLARSLGGVSFEVDDEQAWVEGDRLSRSTVETAHEGVRGSPAYMAPEQWREEEPTAATDLWALGIVLYEMIHGRHPYEGADTMQLCHRVGGGGPAPRVQAAAPAPLVRLVERCMDKRPAGRPSAEEAVRELAGLLERGPGPAGAEIPPFRGLLPFDERHARQFHGRDAEIAAFLDQLREHPVLPVVGPSGAGKSSFVLAGVLPRLREQGRWIVLRMRPGRRPLRVLARRLEAGPAADESVETTHLSGEGPVLPDGATMSDAPSRDLDLDRAEAALAEELKESPARLALRLVELAEKERRRGSPAKILLFVDQLEELFTLVEDEALRRTVLEAICTAADDPQGPVRVVFTVRADFMGHLTASRAAREALTQVTVLGPPGREALRAILTSLVAASGYRYDDAALVDEMVDAVADEAAALPLLQFAGQMLWSRRDRDRRLLRRADHDAMGGVAGALAHHADGLLEGLSPAQLRSARAILLGLITEQGTRQVMRYGDLPWDQLQEGAYEVLDRLVRGRLVVVRGLGGAGGGSRTGAHSAEIELVHESLIHHWDRLSAWIDESREERAFAAEVGQAAALWHRRGEREDELWSGDALADALRAWERNGAALPDRSRTFLERAQQREQRRQRRRRLVLAGAIAASVALALVMAVLALEARRQEAVALREQRAAEEERAVAQREAARAALAQGSPLEARAKLRSSLETLDSVDARALWWRLRTEPLRWRTKLGGGVNHLTGSQDGRWFVAGTGDGTLHLFDVHTGRDTILRGHRDDVRCVVVAHGGRRVVSGTYEGDVGFWDVAAGRQLAMHRAHESYVTELVSSADGTRVASGAWDGSVQVWDATSGEPLVSIPAREPPSLGLAFSPDGGRLVSGNPDGTVAVWDATTGARVATLAGHEDVIHYVEFSPDGRQVGTASWDGTARLWDWELGEATVVLRGHQGRVNSVSFQPGGDLVATAGSDGTVRVWARADGAPRWVFAGHGSRDPRIRFSSDGRLLASRADDRTIRVYDLEDEGRVRLLHGHRAAITALAFLADGRHLVSGDYQSGLFLWRVDPGVEPAPRRGHDAPLSSVDASPRGDVAVTTSSDRSIRLWDVSTGEERGIVGHLDDGGMVARYSVDGGLIAAAGLDGRIHVWDADSGEKALELVGHEGPVHDLDFHPDGASLVSTSADQTVRLWDLSSGQTSAVLEGHETYLVGLGIAPDGNALLTTGADGSLALWRSGPWRLAQLAHPSAMALWGAAFLGDGQRFVTGGDDRAVHLGTIADLEAVEALPATDRPLYPAVHPDGERLGIPLDNGLAWIGDGGERTVLRGHRRVVTSFAFTPDGSTALTTSEDGTVRAWDVESGAPRWWSPGLVTSPPEAWTHEGWQALGPAEDAAGLDAAWRRRVADGVRILSAAPGRAHLCLLTGGGALELWETASDRRAAQWSGPLYVDVAASSEGCWSRDSDGTVSLHRAAGEAEELARGATALAADERGAVLAVEREVLLVGPGGEVLRRAPGDVGITAVGRSGEALAVGFEEGSVQLLLQGADGGDQVQPLSDPPSAAATRLIPGPPGTLAAGFADGTFGLWSAADGNPLVRAKLHGAVEHLLLEDSALYAVTDLGDHARLDLAVLDEDYCGLMRALWDEVPVTWTAGRALHEEPDPAHPCAKP